MSSRILFPRLKSVPRRRIQERTEPVNVARKSQRDRHTLVDLDPPPPNFHEISSCKTVVKLSLYIVFKRPTY